MFLIISIISVAVILLFIILSYNSGVRLRNYVKEAFATMDVYLKQRWALIPNLLESVKAYTKHEKSLLTDITTLRSAEYSQLSDTQKLETNMKLDGLLNKFIAVCENYPDIKANEGFMQFNSKLVSIEEDIANARKYYNGTVRELNNFAEIFPTNIICLIFGIKEEKMFEISDVERQNIKVSFDD